MSRRNLCLSKCAVWLVLCLVAAAVSQAETYTYDTVGRLTGVTYDSGKVLSYTYDDNGNLLKRTVTDAMAGDINGDSVVNALDVQLVINEALGIDTGNNCDINNDGNVDALDVQLVINAALGIDISGSI